jgi:hypothetical protein
MEPPVRSFSISSSGSRIWGTFSSFLVTSISGMSMSWDAVPLSSCPNSGSGVPAAGRTGSASGLRPSSRFSLPPALDGIGLFLSLPALAPSRSGVAEPPRDSERGRPVFSLVMTALVAAFDGGALVVTVVFFLSGFSGAGHSTSWSRSILSALTHSSKRLLNST